jgi:hypothetical protein
MSNVATFLVLPKSMNGQLGTTFHWTVREARRQSPVAINRRLSLLASIRLGALFLTLPTHVLTGQQVISSDGWGAAGFVACWSFNDLVGESADCGRDRQPQCFGGSQVDHQLEFGGLVDRDVARFGTPSSHPICFRSTTWPL